MTMTALRRRTARWLLFSGDRRAVAGCLLVAVFLTLAALHAAGVIDLTDRAAVRGVAGGLIPGLFAFLSIVLSINQLVLSQEFGAAGEIRERVRNVREYRHDVEAVADRAPSPILPTGFIEFVVVAIESQARDLEASVREAEGPAAADVADFARSVNRAAGRADDRLEQAQPGRVNALLPVLEYDDAGQLYEARRLRRKHGDALPGEALRALSRLTEAVELFSVARTRFRTTYTQRTLSRLSRKLLYVGVPALLVAAVMGLLAPSTAPLVPDRLRAHLASALLTAALAPLAVLSAYLLRIAAVSERTVSVGPFVSRPGTDERGSAESAAAGTDDADGG